MRLRSLIYGLIGYFCLLPAAKTHQPVMDMAPRWAQGYGIQSWYEYSNDETQIQEVEEHTVRLEGVYTFTREHRITLKIPISNKRVIQNGQESSSNYLGDTVIGFQNKLYFNERKFTANLGLNPGIRVPTQLGFDDSFSPKRSLGYSLSLSASLESFLWYGLIDFFYWGNTRNSDGTKPQNLFGFDLDIGYHPYHNNSLNMGLFLMMGFDGRYYQSNNLVDQNTKGSIMQIVPTLVLYKDNIMFRFEYYIPVWQGKNQGLNADSSLLRLGIGVTFE